MVSVHVLPLLLVGLAWQPAHAAQLYKWVDGAGQVTYSSHPPPAGIRAEKVEAPPQPTTEEVRQTEERVKRIEEQAGKLEDQRRQKEAAEAEAARLRALQSPPAPIVIEQPVYMPEPIYYPPVRPPRKRHHDKAPRHPPRPDGRERTRGSPPN